MKYQTLLNDITTKDKELIHLYCSMYAGGIPQNFSKVFYPWAQSKKTLYSLLGRTLDYSFPISIYKDDEMIQKELEEVYPFISRYTVTDDYMPENAPIFIKKYVSFFCNMKKESFYGGGQDAGFALSLLAHSRVKSGTVGYLDHGNFVQYTNNGKTIKIIPNMRIMKALKKIVDLFEICEDYEFEEFRNKISNITTDKEIKTDMHLSIHPLDFMTMSDNACNWSSCMSWKDNGGYRCGTIEMMNSNCVIVAYTSSKKPYCVDGRAMPNNKNWRQMFYVTKDLLLGGRSYPYDNYELTEVVLDKLMELAENNLGWTYQYKKQEYGDMSHLWYNASVFNNRDRDRHNILVYTNEMYNDIMETENSFLCCRNYVKKPRLISLSGKRYCLCCGDELTPAHAGGTLVCPDCVARYTCKKCGKVSHNLIKVSHCNSSTYRAEDINVCPECLAEMKTCSKCGKKTFPDSYKKIYLFPKDIDVSKLQNFISPSGNYVGSADILMQDNKKELEEKFGIKTIHLSACEQRDRIMDEKALHNTKKMYRDFMIKTNTYDFMFGIISFRPSWGYGQVGIAPLERYSKEFVENHISKPYF